MALRLMTTLCLGMAFLVGPAGCACSGKKSISAQSAASLTGTLSYREKIALDSRAEVVVTLIDMDAGARSLASRTFPADGKQVPIAFQLPYTLGDIRREGNYGVTARITLGGATLFESAEPLPVLTQGRPSRELELTLRRGGS